jgi:VanZ family protein
MKIVLKSFWPGVVWLLLATIAFCLPGQVLPKGNWVRIIHFDKGVHLGIFLVTTWLWCLPVLYRFSHRQNLAKLAVATAFAIFCYGILIEIIQHFFIAYRTFDWRDIAADGAGCLIGFLIARSQWKR